MPIDRAMRIGAVVQVAVGLPGLAALVWPELPLEIRFMGLIAAAAGIGLGVMNWKDAPYWGAAERRNQESKREREARERV
jgi:hypothetical protein